MKLIKIFLILVLLSAGVKSYAELLDKVAFVVDDTVFTQSTLERIKSTLAARKMVSPMLYPSLSMDSKSISSVLINSILIRDRLTEMGYSIGDDQVESEIKSTEKNSKLNRDALLLFLKQNNITFDEYFELTREAIEYGIFVSRVIGPLVSVTDQEVKNSYYKDNISNKMLSFKYDLVDFSLHKKNFKGTMVEDFPSVMRQFQATGNLSANFSQINTNALGNVTEDGLTEKLQILLKNTNEGSFSNTALIGDEYHVFFVKEKNLVESSEFLNNKDKIREILFQKATENMASLWYQRESNRHYIKSFL